MLNLDLSFLLVIQFVVIKTYHELALLSIET